MKEAEVTGRLLLLAALAAGGCLDRRSEVCSDGRLCAAGTVCVASLDLCVDPARIEACAPPAEDGDTCSTDEIDSGTCSDGVCFGSGCGNGLLEEDEACDDGNTVSGDGCSADCLSNELCGNGVIDRDEQCDCGIGTDVSPDCAGPNSATGGRCRPDCQLHCGDGIVAPDEACDFNAPEQPSCLDLDGAGFDRGLTMCSSTCTPVIDETTCRYVGWRHRRFQMEPHVVDVAPIADGEGFFAAGDLAGHYVGYDPTNISPSAGGAIAAVWSRSPQRAVAVGAGGAALHFEDPDWTVVQAAEVDLHDVWGRADDDVYAVGDGGTVVRFDGADWVPMTTPTEVALRGISGHGDEVYAVGDGGTILRLDAGSWQLVASGTAANLVAVAVTGAGAAAVGAGGTIVEERGAGWSLGRAPTAADLTDVWGSDEDGLFAVGDATVLFFDGAVWRPLSIDGHPLAGPQEFLAIGAEPGGEIVVVGRHTILTYEGSAWSAVPIPTTEMIRSLWGTGPDEVFAVGSGGLILHHDGLSWTPQESPTTADLLGVWGTAGDDVYAVGAEGTLLHYDGEAWAPLSSPTTATLLGVWTRAGRPLVVAGEEGIFHLEGGTWTHRVTEDGQPPFNVVWGLDETSLWAARGDGRLWHNDGAGWMDSFGSSGIMVDFTGRDPSAIYAVGVGSAQFDGESWSPGPFGTASSPPNPASDPLYGGVWDSATVGVFAVGADGRIERFDGVTTERIRGRFLTYLNDVFITERVIFMAGAYGTLQTLVFHR